MNTRWVLMLRIFLGGLLLWAGFAKLAAPMAFFGALLGYELPLSDTVLRLITIALPWLEVLCGATLLVDFWPETVRPLTMALTLSFVVLLSQALGRGLEIDCGCFGGGKNAFWNSPAAALARAIALLIAASVLTLQNNSPQRRGGRGVSSRSSTR